MDETIDCQMHDGRGKKNQPSRGSRKTVFLCRIVCVCNIPPTAHDSPFPIGQEISEGGCFVYSKKRFLN